MAIQPFDKLTVPSGVEGLDCFVVPAQPGLLAMTDGNRSVPRIPTELAVGVGPFPLIRWRP